MTNRALKSDGKTPILNLAADALVERAKQLAGPAEFRGSHSDYTATAKANLLPYIEVEDFEGDLAGGAGSELSDNGGCPAKVCAAQLNPPEPWVAKHADALVERYGVSLAPGKDALSMAV